MLGTAPKAWVPTGHASSPAELAHPFPPLAATSPRPVLSREIPSQKRAALRRLRPQPCRPQAGTRLSPALKTLPRALPRAPPGAAAQPGARREVSPGSRGGPPGRAGSTGALRASRSPEQQGGARAGGAARPLLNSAGNVKVISSQVKTKRARCGR